MLRPSPGRMLGVAALGLAVSCLASAQQPPGNNPGPGSAPNTATGTDAKSTSAARPSSEGKPAGKSAGKSKPGSAPRSSASGGARDKDSIYTLYKDGKAHEIPIVTRDGDDYLALQELAGAMGAEVSGVAAGVETRVALPGSEIAIKPGDGDARVNGKSFSLSRAPIFASGRLWVPTDFVTKVLAVALERAVKWKEESTGLLASRTGDAKGPLTAEVEVRSQRDYTRVLVRVPAVGLLPYTINAPSGKIVVRVQADQLSARQPELLVGDGALERVVFGVQGGRGTFTLELGSDFRDYQHAVLRDPFRVVVDLYRKNPYTGPANRASTRPEGRGQDPLATAPARPPIEAAPGPGRAESASGAPLPSDLLPPGSGLTGSAGLTPGGAASAPLAGSPGMGAGGLPLGGPARDSGGLIRTVVVDAGHGGTEPGARGPGGMLEKDITLDLSRRLARMLEANLGMRVVLTRSADVDVSLDDRTGIANHEKADLFICIHANASPRANAHGAETYFLASHASDDESRKLAAIENQVLGEARGLEGTDLELILWSLAQNQYLKESQDFAETIQKQLNAMLDISDRGVKQAPFKVLVGATMPAVLVEVGFITNPEEEKRLRDEAYKNKIVTALYQSVREFKVSREVKMGGLAAPVDEGPGKKEARPR